MSDLRMTGLAAWAEARLPRLIDEVCTRVLDRIPLYRTEQAVPVAELRSSIEHNLRFVIAALGSRQGPRDLTVPQQTGRRRAHQGVPLPEVLQVYRISFATLWDSLVQQAQRIREVATADALLAVASNLWQITDEHALAVTEAYRDETSFIVRAQQRRRSALVEALLTGYPGPTAGPLEAAALLGLSPDGDLVVVAAETAGIAEEGLPEIERKLAAIGVPSGWRLNPALQLGIVAVGPRQLDAVLEMLRETASTRTGVSPLYRSLSDTPRSLRLARTALAMLAEGSVGVQVFRGSPLLALLACAPDEGTRLIQDVLGPVLALPAEDRDTLIETLDTYLQQSGSAEVTATLLHCHPNTVRYRLRRLQELTGRSPSRPSDLAELSAAVSALQISPLQHSSVQRAVEHPHSNRQAESAQP